METNLLHESFTVDEEHAAQTDTLLLNKNTIVPTNLVGRVTQQWYIDIA